MFLPVAYNRKLYELAEVQKDFSALMRRLDIKGHDCRDCVEFVLPSTDSRAILVIEQK
jgi:hypothetical protein